MRPSTKRVPINFNQYINSTKLMSAALTSTQVLGPMHHDVISHRPGAVTMGKSRPSHTTRGKRNELLTFTGINRNFI